MINTNSSSGMLLTHHQPQQSSLMNRMFMMMKSDIKVQLTNSLDKIRQDMIDRTIVQD